MLDLNNWQKMNYLMEQKNNKHTTRLKREIDKIGNLGIVILGIIAKAIKTQESIMIER